MNQFLNTENQTFLITGVANKKSLAYFVAQKLQNFGSKIILAVQNDEIAEKVKNLFPNSPILICDVSRPDHLNNLFHSLKPYGPLNGFLHSLAYARFSPTPQSFHETSWDDFQLACQISSFSLTQIVNAIKNNLTIDASVVTISISTTKATSYGHLGPIKAMLEAQIPYLAKSFSEFSRIRFNAVCAGPLKTSASAGIPNFMENYLYAEQLTLRKKALKTEEVANTILFLLSNASSGINGTNIVVDAGMSCNYFDEKIVKAVTNQLF